MAVASGPAMDGFGFSTSQLPGSLVSLPPLFHSTYQVKLAEPKDVSLEPTSLGLVMCGTSAPPGQSQWAGEPLTS